MDLPIELIKEFAKTTNDEQIINEGSTVYGRYVLQGDKAFVEIDGSDGLLTPVATTSTAKNNDRVTVLIKDHTAIVTGNLTDPSASSEKVEELSSNLDLGLNGLEDAIKKTQDNLTDLSEDVTIKYTDIDGNIQTIETKLGKVSSQVTGMAASIEGTAKVATNYIGFEEGYGLVIGDLTGNTLGFNTLLDATSLNIRYNDIVLAKYAADTIYLGYNSNSSKINLLNGLGIIEAMDGALGIQASTVRIYTPGLEVTRDPWMHVSRKSIGLHGGSASLSLISGSGSLNGIWSIPSDSHSHSQYATFSELSGYYSAGDNIYANKLYISNAGNISGDPNARLAVSSPYQIGYASGSSMWFKHDIKPVENEELDPKHLYDIKVYQFKYNDDYLNENDQRYGVDCIGFIAEQVNSVYPIAADRETGKPRNWEMRYIIPPMLALIQDHKKEIDALKSKITELESREVS